MAYALMSKAEYALLPIAKEGWQELAETENQAEIAFVDGGNSPIIQAPTAELHKIRTAVALIRGKRLVNIERKEGLLLAKSSVEGGKTAYGGEFLESNLDCDAIQTEITASYENALTKAAEEARRMCELAAAMEAIKLLGGEGSFIVLDGTLETPNAAEMKAMKELATAAAPKKVIIGAVAKTCSILADTGDSLISVVGKIGGGTGYVVIAEGRSEGHNATIAIARLNKSAQHLFRIEAATAEELRKLIAALKEQSNDLAFPGYPYGLIMADEFARISNSEAELQKAKTMATATGYIGQLVKEANALNAHGILDRM